MNGAFEEITVSSYLMIREENLRNTRACYFYIRDKNKIRENSNIFNLSINII